MDYTTLKSTVNDITENTTPDPQLDIFTAQVEQKIYNTVQFPALRKNVTGTMTTGNTYLSTPTDFLFPYSLSVIDGIGDHHYLLNKDVNFIREAYPQTTPNAIPKYYALFDDDSLILGPAPDANYSVQLHYGYYPESIVTASTTWLGDNFDNALLNGVLVEVLRFQKGEPDLVAMYDKMYIEAITLLKTLADGKLRQDSYRSGQARVPVT
jgi:hypothetical protein